MLFAGMLTGMLAVDDMLLIHENVIPRNTPLPEEVLLGVYGVATLALLFWFRDTILGSENVLLLIAFGLLAASVFVDQLHLSNTYVAVLEDGPKFVGIACWAAYFLRVSWLHLEESVSRP